MGLLDTIRAEGAAIAQAPWSFVICVAAIGVVIYLGLSHLKAQEISDLESRLKLRDDEISDYKRKLNGASPDEARARIDALEAKVAGISPRRLSPEQREAVRAAVAQAPASIEIANDMAATDARGFAADLTAAFQSAGWDVSNPMIAGPSNPPSSGLSVTVADPTRLTRSQEAFLKVLNSIGVGFDLRGGPIRNVPGRPTPEISLLVTTPVR